MKCIVLVSCCGPKAKTPTLGKDLYRSALFAEARAWAERNGDEWFILSAKLHVVKPNQRVVPYEKKLKDVRGSKRVHWDNRVARQLERFSEADIVVLAGKDYCGWCARFKHVRQPLAGIAGIGRRIAWLKQHPVERLAV